MSILEPCTENMTQDAENALLFNDWVMPEMNPTGANVPFDGKIIARMPDLGDDCSVRNIEKPKSTSLWTRAFASTSSNKQKQGQFDTTAFANPSQNTRQQFFLRLTSLGCVVLLCGIVMLFLERSTKQTDKPGIDTAAIVVESPEPLIANDPIIVFNDTTPLVPILQPELSHPAFNGMAVPPPAAGSPTQSDSVWNRPAADSFSPWDHAPRQPENPFGNTAAANHPPTAVAMHPMTDMTAQVSPFEHQLVAQSSPPVDPFVQPPGNVVQGMTPTHARQENNAPGIATSQGSRQTVAPPLYPQYLPPSAVQGVHPSYSQEHPQAVPSNMPIPSAISTLPTQTGQYPQQQPQQNFHGAASPHPTGGNYYNAAPPTYRFY